MDIYITIVGFFQSGGIFMYPIVLILALGLAIALERWLYLSKARITNQLVWKKLQPLLQNELTATGQPHHYQAQEQQG